MVTFEKSSSINILSFPALPPNATPTGVGCDWYALPVGCKWL
jgi:hypothetical protein